MMRRTLSRSGRSGSSRAAVSAARWRTRSTRMVRKELLLAGKMSVKRSFGDTTLGRDLIHRCRLVASTGEYAVGRIEDGLCVSSLRCCGRVSPRVIYALAS